MQVSRFTVYIPFLQIVRTMLLRPIQTKYKKTQKNLRAVTPVPGRPLVKPSPCFGAYGIYAKEPIRLKASQIEAARYAILKTVGKKGLRIWVRTFPHIPVTKKPLEVRMGKGKGAVDHFVSYVKMGAMLYEYNCPNMNTAKLACKAAAYKLPIKVGFVHRDTEK